jgi:hypothetical protein
MNHKKVQNLFNFVLKGGNSIKYFDKISNWLIKQAFEKGELL